MKVCPGSNHNISSLAISPELYLRFLKDAKIKHTCGKYKGKEVRFEHIKKGVYKNPIN